jgi:hypothetical protein
VKFCKQTAASEFDQGHSTPVLFTGKKTYFQTHSGFAYASHELAAQQTHGRMRHLTRHAKRLFFKKTFVGQWNGRSGTSLAAALAAALAAPFAASLPSAMEFEPAGVRCWV